MTQRELEKLLKDAAVQQEMEHGLLGDPGLWLTDEEMANLDAGQLERRAAERKAELKRRVLVRLRRRTAAYSQGKD
jgi:hypothetical protein